MSVPSPDDLDREQLEQLHAATLKSSEACLELKKLCAVVLVPVGTLLVKFGDQRPGISFFVGELLVIAAFWVADSFSYYYQRKLREAMVTVWRRRAGRCSEEYHSFPTSGAVSPVRAALNASMAYYLILGILVGVAGVAYSFG